MEDYTKEIVVFIKGDILGGDSVYENLTRCRFVESTEKLDEGGLARTVYAYDRQRFTTIDGDIYIFKDHSIGLGVFEGYITKLDFDILGDINVSMTAVFLDFFCYTETTTKVTEIP